MITFEQARLWYPTSDPAHGFDHIERVVHLACRLALAEGADEEIVFAAALLHDAQDPACSPASPDASLEHRQTHHHASASFARKVLLAENWQEERIARVEHCIRSHRFRDPSEPPATLEARVLFDADKLDAIGATGAARAVAYAAQAGMPAFYPPSPQFVASGSLSPGELYSAYHEYLFKLQKLKDRLYTQTGRTLAQERHRFLADFFSRLEAEHQGIS
jgi:uncharacterized protein